MTFMVNNSPFAGKEGRYLTSRQLRQRLYKAARQNVEVALAPQRLSRSEREDRVSELLEAVGLGPRGEHLPSELSGGEQQRVSIARALANRPRILLADEPTGNLDSATGEEIVALLRSISDQRGQAVVLITHDASIAARAGRVVRMQDGRLLEPVTMGPC